MAKKTSSVIIKQPNFIERRYLNYISEKLSVLANLSIVLPLK